MDDHNIGVDVKVTLKQKHSYEEPVLAQQTDQTSPEEIQLDMSFKREIYNNKTIMQAA